MKRTRTPHSSTRGPSPPAAVIGIVLIAAGAATAAAPARPKTGSGWPALVEKVDPWISDLISREKLPGVTVAVTKGGRLILSKGYGYANTSRNTHMEPIMRSRIGSVSKAVVTGPSGWQLLKAKGYDHTTKKLYGPDGVFGTKYVSDYRIGIGRHRPIVAIAISNADRVAAWYQNGTVSVGSTNDLDRYAAPTPFKLPPGKTPNDIRGADISKDGKVYVWYDEGRSGDAGKRSIGSITDLARYSGLSPDTVSLPPGKTMNHVVGIGIAKSNDHVYIAYEDGTISSGTSMDFDYHFGPTRFQCAGGAGGTSYDIREIAISKEDRVYAWFANDTASAGTSTDLDRYHKPYPYSTPTAGTGGGGWESWYRRMTLKNLMDHYAGFTESGDIKGAMRLFGVSESNLTYEQIHQHFLRTRKLLWEPGTAYQYSNHGFGLWTLLIETMSGQSYPDYATNAYLRPMGLHDDILPERRLPDSRDAWNHELRDGRPVPVPFEESGLGLAAGGWRASAQDLLKLTSKLAERYSSADLDEMGWARGSRGELEHDGKTGGGSAFVVMYPKEYESWNGRNLKRVQVAIVTNLGADTGELKSVASQIAFQVELSEVPGYYDLWKAKPANPRTGKPVN